MAEPKAPADAKAKKKHDAKKKDGVPFTVILPTVDSASDPATVDEKARRLAACLYQKFGAGFVVRHKGATLKFDPRDANWSRSDPADWDRPVKDPAKRSRTARKTLAR